MAWIEVTDEGHATGELKDAYGHVTASRGAVAAAASSRMIDREPRTRELHPRI